MKQLDECAMKEFKYGNQEEPLGIQLKNVKQFE